jgi:chemotaxis protein MotB
MADEPHPELVIIKRHGGHHDDHHGGAWKIAFADFMTAMMALFLVLWLISATNPKQRIVIARYFNPVKLTEASSNKKGLNDPDDGGGPQHAPPKPGEPVEKKLELPPAADKHSLFDVGARPTYDEAAMFRDPYAVLSEIAAASEYSTKKAVTKAKGGTSGGGGTSSAAGMPTDSNETFRDPFTTVPQQEQQHTAANLGASAQTPIAPTNQSEKPAADDMTLDISDAAPAVMGADGGQPAASAIANDPLASKIPASFPPAKEKSAAPLPKESAKEQSQAPAISQPMSQKTAEMRAQLAAEDMHSNDAEAGKLRSEIATVMNKDTASLTTPNVEVKSTSEGVLISLTDEINYAMFAIGSAEPQQKTIEVMGKVAQLLKRHPGQIVVRGHTDGRPYKSGTYDNWQLSAARAQMAHYMLVRGGLDEQRIERIEGYADHRLKTPSDPLAAENRRIEILVRKDKP